jgi:hypothetical protein
MKLTAGLVVAMSLLACTGAVAQSPDTARSSCPAGYWQLDSQCLNNSTGDVVNAAPPARR